MPSAWADAEACAAAGEKSRDRSRLGVVKGMFSNGAHDVMELSGDKPRLLPWVPRSFVLPSGAQNNITGLPSGNPGVDDSNWYGLLNRDHNETQTDIITAVFEKDFNKSLKLTNITRYGRNTIDLISTPPRFRAAWVMNPISG